MKKSLIEILIVLLTTISFISCENNLTPIVNFSKQYALNCVIRGDTTLQYATIMRSFDTENFNKDSAFVSGAQLKLNYDGNDYIFSDTSSGGTSSIPFYYLKNFKPEIGKQIKIEANLPDGTVLQSTTQTPDPGLFVFYGDKTIPPENFSGVFSIKWLLYNYHGEPLYFMPFLYIEYRKNINGTMVQMQKEVPVEYKVQNDQNIPVYPKISLSSSIEYALNTISRTLTELKEADSVSNGDILNAKFVVRVFDRNLAAYVLSSVDYQEGFSLRIEASDFTNIQGGYGIFGSFIEYETEIPLDPYKLKSINSPNHRTR